MDENLGTIVYNGTIFNLDDPENVDKLEALLEELKKEEKEIKEKIDASINNDLDEKE